MSWSVVPDTRALRGMRWGLAVVVVAWLAATLLDAWLVRVHALGSGWKFAVLVIGIVPGPAAYLVWYGAGFRVRIRADAGCPALVSRTITGMRTLDLGRLTQVRCFDGGPEETGGHLHILHLRDEHGVRLAVGSGEHGVDDAIRTVLASKAGVRVGGHAQRVLGLVPSSRGSHVPAFLLGMVLFLATAWLPAIAGLILASAVW